MPAARRLQGYPRFMGPVGVLTYEVNDSRNKQVSTR